MLQKINGAQYNTKALQQSAYSNIQVKGNALWGEPIVKKVAPTPVKKSVPVSVPKPVPTPVTAPETVPETKLSKNEPYYDKTVAGTGLQLGGQFNDTHKQIADKYSSFFKTPIAIEIVPKKSLDNGTLYNSETMGRTSYYKDGSRRIQVGGDLGDKEFEFVMLHEIAHQVYHYDEDSANNYARQMIDIINNQQ